jgi:hypothetical protein
MQNGLELAEREGYEIGVPLTEEQINSLTVPIVWWEVTIIDGQEVLAPKVYLPEEMRHTNSGGSISSGTGDVNISGQNGEDIYINANEDSVIKGQNINIQNVTGNLNGVISSFDNTDILDEKAKKIKHEQEVLADLQKQYQETQEQYNALSTELNNLYKEQEELANQYTALVDDYLLSLK